MSFVPVFVYMVGIATFGFFYWLLDGLLTTMIDTGVGKTGLILDLLLYTWTGAIIIYLIFGGYWVIRKYNEKEYRGEY